MRYLERVPQSSRILVLERGNEDTKAWQLANQKHTSIDPEDLVYNDNPERVVHQPGLRRQLEVLDGWNDADDAGGFQLKSRYGVGMDWPISYDDLEAHYGVVEQVMLVSGPADSPMPRSRPVPLMRTGFRIPMRS